jgi:lipoprotein-anchoring transpeptidase ErfK/SrfK
VAARAGAAALALVLGLVSVVACGRSNQVAVAPTPSSTAPSTTSTIPTFLPTTTAPAPAEPPKLVPVNPGWTATVSPKGKIWGYDGPGGNPVQLVTNLYYDVPTWLPVIEQAPGWLHVRLAPKPNGSTVWVKTDDVTLGATPYRIVIDLGTTHLKLFKQGVQVLDAPVGVGTNYTPTATGDFFVAFMQKPPSAMYGPFIIITSGHSNVIQSWDGFPDGILGIHGPIGADGMIGTTGAQISNGCIRMHVADQEQLADVLPGTPIQIIPAPAPPPDPSTTTTPPV